MDIFQLLKIALGVCPIDYRTALCHTAVMSRLTRKFVAVLMLLWLPLFSSSALAASLAMQLQQGGCHAAAAVQTMSHENTGEHHQHHGDLSAAADEQQPSCSACGICHLACTGYLAVPEAATVAAQANALEATPYQVSYLSVCSAPLDPPPLARA